MDERFFPALEQAQPHVIFPGVTVRTAWLERMMVSQVDFEPFAVVDWHSHPHEQMGVMLTGRALFLIGDEARELGPHDVYRIPSNVRHKVVAREKPVRAFDVFSPPRDEYK